MCVVQIVYNKVAQFVRMIPEMPGTRNNDDDGVDIDITPWLKRLALDVIGDIAFGKDLNALEARTVCRSPSYASRILWLTARFIR